MSALWSALSCFAALTVVSTVLLVVSTVLFVVSPVLVAALLASSPALLAESAAELAAPCALSAARWLSCEGVCVSSARAVVVLPNPSASAPARPSPISTFRMRHLQNGSRRLRGSWIWIGLWPAEQFALHRRLSGSAS